MVAKNPSHLLGRYPGLDPGLVFGPVAGELSNQGDRLILERPDVVPVGTNLIASWLRVDAELRVFQRDFFCSELIRPVMKGFGIPVPSIFQEREWRLLS